MEGLKFVAIVASVREGRQGERMMKLTEAEFNRVLKPKGHSIEFIDPECFELPLLKKPLYFYESPSDAPANVQKLDKTIKSADVFLIITAEYNRSMPPALVNTLDHISPKSFEHTISGIIGYTQGVTGGCFAMSAVRPLLTEMGCLPVKNFVSVNQVDKEVTVEGTTKNAHIVSAMEKLFTELEWWGAAAKNHRATRS
jgi:NAD(P)H-dependent FMN reductase